MDTTLDFHQAITVKERSSRYLRTAFDFLRRNKGEEVFDGFLKDIGLERDSSIYKHITDDDNWNSYALEIFITERIAHLFDDPYQAVWDFGVASGSGKFDQKSNLFTIKTKIAPVKVLLRKISERTEEVSLISTCVASETDPRKDSPYPKMGRIQFSYDRLPDGIRFPHWTSILAGAGILYGVMRHRKGLDCVLHVTHWPNIPSDFPSWRGERYIFDKPTGNIVHERSGDVVANTADGPFELNGTIFNNHNLAVLDVEWKPESIFKIIGDLTLFRRRRKRQEEQAAYRQKLTNELTREHQAQLARYEKELREKTEIIRQQKIQQDGDYFLTSLLTNPVNRNDNKSPNLTTEFYLDQKKKFSFRNRTGQLGGDLCITDQVELKGRRYVVVFNGDAMGKSLQGAGGMLVMGSLFISHLNRTKTSKTTRDRGPSEFIEQMYHEMQHIFLIFNGSMCMSVFLGLVDEVTGEMHYINAEHPWSVLLRDGKATFIERELLVRKIGYEMDSGVQVQKFQLLPGDMLFVGSDGRDDLAIAQDGGSRVINEDEFEFVRTVEESRGSLEKIIEISSRKGEITDDFSLIKVAFAAAAPDSSGSGQPAAAAAVGQEAGDSGSAHQPEPVQHRAPRADGSNTSAYSEAMRAMEEGDSEKAIDKFEEALDAAGSDPDILYRLGKLYYYQKEYDKTIETIQEWLSSGTTGEHQNEMNYYLSCSFKMQRQFATAIKVGEEVRAKEPNFVNNLLNLVDCYRHTRKYQEAEALLKQALELDPQNGLGRQLKSALERAKV